MTTPLTNPAREEENFQVPQALMRANAAEAMVASLTLRYKSLELDAVTHTCLRDGRPCSLTRLEYQLLAFLLLHQGRVWSRAELTEHAWQREQSNTHAVAVYINWLRRKLEPGIVRTVRGQGYTIDAEDRGQHSFAGPQ